MSAKKVLIVVGDDDILLIVRTIVRKLLDERGGEAVPSYLVTETEGARFRDPLLDSGTNQMRVEQVVYRALRQATEIATTGEGECQSCLRETFEEILCRHRVRTAYQPIFDLNTMEVLGHEALTRGPVDTAFESPELLFEFAGKHEATWDLEQLCIESSGGHYRGPEDGLLFINVEVDSVAALAARPAARAPLEHLRHRVVLEVTERSAIRDMPVFREALAILRKQGFRIAIDDAGSGYASLESIAALRPNFVKVANTLVTGVHADTIKRDAVEGFVNLAHSIGAACVAEGIETPEDLEECRRLGIPYGQGFYLGAPEQAPPSSAARDITFTKAARQAT